MMKEKYISTLLGCAMGDTLGMPVEGWKPEQIKRYVGRITEPLAPAFVGQQVIEKGGEHEFRKLKFYSRDLEIGEYTDDTILTLALAESLVARGFDLDDVGARQLYEYTSRLQADGTVKGGFGRTTKDAFENLRGGKSAVDSGVIGGPGNGPAMKMSPLGLYMHATGQYRAGLEFAERVGRITHLDPRSVAGGVLQAHAVHSAIAGISREEFLESLVDIVRAWEKPVTREYHLHDKGTLASRIEWVRDNCNASPAHAHNILKSTSVTWSSQPFALFMFQRYWDEPLEGLIETVNFGGDCDTTGAMYGALAGARHGIFWPEEWHLQDKQKMRLLGEQLHACH